MARPIARNWLKTPFGLAVYLAGWATFVSGHMALFIFSYRYSFWQAATSSLFVVAPAALLGIPAISLSRRNLRSWSNPAALLAFETAWAAGFAMTWTLSVSLAFSIKDWAEGEAFDYCLPQGHVLHWHMLSGMLIYATLALGNIWMSEIQGRQEERSKAEQELLLAKFNPHFLFNTLHSIRELIRSDPERAEKAHDGLAELLRRALRVQRNSDQPIPLRQEWHFCKLYLDLEKIRYGDRLQLDERIDPSLLDYLVPPFLLQPLIENAVRHGIGMRAEGGTISASAVRMGDRMQVSITDDGGPTDPWQDEGAGLGLHLVRERVRAFSPNRGRVTLAPGEESGFRVTVELPLIEELPQQSEAKG